MKPVIINHVAFTVSLNCTLKCKRCSMLSPYIKNSYKPSFVTLKQHADALFQIADKVEYINITGGEPLLRADDRTLANLLEYLSEKPDDKLGKIRIYTNGTVVPSDDLCKTIVQILKEKTFWFEIDDYGILSTKLRELTEKLEAYKIKYNVRDYSKNLYYDGWVDFRHVDTIKRDAQAAIELYDKCACGEVVCLGFIDGVLVACPGTYVRYMCGEIDKNHDEVIDLLGDVDQMRKKWVNLSERKFFETCLYCPDGICKDSRRYLPTEQVSKDEIEGYCSKYQMRY